MVVSQRLKVVKVKGLCCVNIPTLLLVRVRRRHFLSLFETLVTMEEGVANLMVETPLCVYWKSISIYGPKDKDKRRGSFSQSPCTVNIISELSGGIYSSSHTTHFFFF